MILFLFGTFTGILLAGVALFCFYIVRNRSGTQTTSSLNQRSGANQAELQPLNESFKTSEASFRRLFEQLPLAIQILSKDGRIVEANRAWEKLWGITVDQIPDYNLFHDRQLDSKGLLKPILRAFEGETIRLPATPYDLDETLPNRSINVDPVRRVTLTAYPAIGTSGTIENVVMIVEDVTAEKKADIAMKESEKRLRLIADLIPQLIWNTDAAGSLIWCNQRWRDYHGTDRLPADNIWHHSYCAYDRETLRSHFETIPQKQEPWQKRFQIRHQDGRLIWHLCNAVPVYNEMGQVEQWFGTDTDISATVEKEDQLVLATQVAQIGIISINYLTDMATPDTIAAELFGVTADEPISRDVLHQRFHPDDGQKIAERINQVLQGHGESVFSIDHRIVLPDGHVRWLSVRKQIRFGKSGAESALLTAFDITDKTIAQATLARREAEYRMIYETSGIGHAEAAFDTRLIVRVNQKFCDLTGYQREELIGKSLYDISDPADRQLISDAIRLCVNKNHPSYEIENRLVHKDGQSVWVNLVGTPIRDESGQIVRLLASVQDVTDRKEIEMRILESEQRLRAFMENSPTVAFIKDEAGRFVFVNRQLSKLVGVPAQSMIGKTDFEIFNQGNALQFRQSDLAAIKSNHPEQFIESVLTPIGTRYFHSFKFPIQTFNRENQMAGLAIDVTDQQLAEQALKDADNLKNQFMATLAHELRNPLAPIRNAVEVIQHKGDSDPDLKQIGGMLQRQVKQMTRLLDDLIEVNRITRKRMELSKAIVSLSSVLNSSIETSQSMLDEYNVHLALNLPSDEILLEGDSVRLAQLFSNLLNNSAKFTPSGGEVVIYAQVKGPDVVISVKDTGIGIAPESLPHVFEIFWQGNPGQVKMGSGLGIGLALVRGLAELHGGSVSAQSEGLGKGCEFLIRLPLLAKGTIPTTAPTSRCHSEKSNVALKILVVDDNRDSADSMAIQLKLKGHLPETAYDGEQALAKLQFERPDVILMDIGMPGRDGYEIAKVVRLQDWGRAIMLIAMTGWGQQQDKVRALQAGFDQHLTKPLDLTVLDLLLEEVQRAKSV